MRQKTALLIISVTGFFLALGITLNPMLSTFYEEAGSTWHSECIKGIIIGLGIVLIFLVIFLIIRLLRRCRREKKQ